MGASILMRRFQSKHAGFTLIELAVVTAIIGLLVAGAVASFGAIRTNTKIKETHRAMHSAELLLRTFIARNGRLPCPADPTLNPNVVADAATYAREDDGGAGTGCTGNQVTGTTVYWGTLPARDLGAEPREIADGWGRQLRYAVVDGSTRTNSLTTGIWALNNNTSEIQLWDKAADDATAPAPQLIVDVGVAAVYSTGPNGSGGITLEGSFLVAPVATALAELENQDDDINLANAAYSEDDATPFDDIISVYTEHDLVLPLAEMGVVQTKRAVSTELMNRWADVVLGMAAADADRLIPAAGAVVFNDAWGQPFGYTPHAEREVCHEDKGVPPSVAKAADILFTLATGSDPGGVIAFNITRGEAAARLGVPITTLCP